MDQMQEAFLNMLLNALDAVSGSESRDSDEPGRVRIRAELEDGGIAISFEDNGIGIPEGELDRIFQFGFTTKSLGTGIGLAYTRRIIEDHGGRIEVESREGTGTTLRCFLPLEPQISDNLANLAIRSQLLENPRELILEEDGEDLGI